MTVDLLSAILSYATIPVYVFGLLFLIYIISRSQLGFSISEEVKEVVETEIAEHRPKTKTPISIYLLVAALFVLLIGGAMIAERKQHL